MPQTITPLGGGTSGGGNPLPPPGYPGVLTPPGSSELLGFVAVSTVDPASSASEISTVPRETLNDVGESQMPATAQLQCAGAGTPISFGYGRFCIGARILHPVVSVGNELLVPGFLVQGRIDAIEGVKINNESPVDGTGQTLYLGTQSQTVDTDLQSAWQALGYTYADAMPGMAYFVIKLPSDPKYRLGNFSAVVRGLCLYDPRKDSTCLIVPPSTYGSGSHRLNNPATWEYSADPVLALAHFLSTPGFGPQETLDWATVAACATISDQDLTTGGNTEKRRRFGLCFDTAQKVDAIEDVLRSYAGVFVVRDGPVVRFVPDAIASSVFAYTNAAPSNFVLDSLTVARRNRDSSPTVVTVRWTDTTQMPWATQEVTVKATGVDEGTLPWLESVISWPGCQSAGMAYREGVRRINEFAIADSTANLIGLDDSIKVRQGDVVTVSDGEGFNAKPFRVTSAIPNGLGRWKVALSEYQEGLYSDVVYTGPTIPDAGLPSPADPPTPANLDAVEEIYQDRGGGFYASRLKITWDASTWPFVDGYAVTVRNGANVVDAAYISRVASPEYRTPPLPEGNTYDVSVAIVSSTGALSATPATIPCEMLGTKLPPSDVPSITGLSISGEILLYWGSAIDIDLTGYEIRVGTTSQSWEPATDKVYVDRLDALSTRIKGLPAGTWRCWIKARDSIRSQANPYGQYSTNAIYCDVVVDADAGAFLLSSHQFTTPNLSNMVAQPREGLPTAYVTDSDAGYFGIAFTDYVGTYTDPLASYYGSFPAYLMSEPFDFGSLISGNWSIVIDYTNIVGAGSPFIDLSDDGASYDRYYTTTKRAARYARVGIETTGTARVVVRGMPSVRLDAVGRTESSDGTVNSLNQGAKTVSLAGHYSKLVSLTITPEATVGRIAVYSNVVLGSGTNSFDVRIFDLGNGLQTATPFRWSLVGI